MVIGSSSHLCSVMIMLTHMHAHTHTHTHTTHTHTYNTHTHTHMHAHMYKHIHAHKNTQRGRHDIITMIMVSTSITKPQCDKWLVYTVYTANSLNIIYFRLL